MYKWLHNLVKKLVSHFSCQPVSFSFENYLTNSLKFSYFHHHSLSVFQKIMCLVN